MPSRAEHWEQQFFNRRKQILKQIKGQALLVVSAPVVTKNRDQAHTYAQDSNFYYLTGFTEPESALLLIGNTRGPRSILFLRDRNLNMEHWEGERLGLKRARRRFRVDEVRSIENAEQELPSLLGSTSALHFTPGVHPQWDELVWGLFRSTLSPRTATPHTLIDARLLLSEMRLVKDRFELGLLRHAIDITAHALVKFAPRIREIKSEAHGAKLLEALFAELGATETSFATIVASGKNATTLHHHPQLQPLWKRELVLIDAGAQFRGYAGDISRTLPASGRFTGAQADLYDVVLAGLRAGINRTRPGASLATIHTAVARELTAGLISLKLLRGSLSDLVSSAAYRRFFTHRAGHFLGLDVHDIAPLGREKLGQPVSSHLLPLPPGAVITMEPGLYFDPKDDSVPEVFRGVGIRIEEDVLVTASGAEVLSGAMPVERDQIEALMN